MDEEGIRRERQDFESWVIEKYGPLVIGTRDCDLLWQGWREGRASVLRPVEAFLEHLKLRGGLMPGLLMTFDISEKGKQP